MAQSRQLCIKLHLSTLFEHVGDQRLSKFSTNPVSISADISSFSSSALALDVDPGNRGRQGFSLCSEAVRRLPVQDAMCAQPL